MKYGRLGYAFVATLGLACLFIPTANSRLGNPLGLAEDIMSQLPIVTIVSSMAGLVLTFFLIMAGFLTKRWPMLHIGTGVTIGLIIGLSIANAVPNPDPFLRLMLPLLLITTPAAAYIVLLLLAIFLSHTKNVTSTRESVQS